MEKPTVLELQYQYQYHFRFMVHLDLCRRYGVHYRLHTVHLCGVFYLPWNRHSGTRDHGFRSHPTDPLELIFFVRVLAVGSNPRTAPIQDCKSSVLSTRPLGQDCFWYLERSDLLLIAPKLTSVVCGTWKWRTCWTLGISRPLAATSVASKTAFGLPES